MPLSRVDPLSHGFKVRVKFDRPFKSEWMRSFGPNRSPVKELVSMDVVLYDEEVCPLFLYALCLCYVVAFRLLLLSFSMVPVGDYLC